MEKNKLLILTIIAVTIVAIVCVVMAFVPFYEEFTRDTFKLKVPMGSDFKKLSSKSDNIMSPRSYSAKDSAVANVLVLSFNSSYDLDNGSYLTTKKSYLNND